jgi:hypothetical protein
MPFVIGRESWWDAREMAQRAGFSAIFEIFVVRSGMRPLPLAGRLFNLKDRKALRATPSYS